MGCCRWLAGALLCCIAPAGVVTAQEKAVVLIAQGGYQLPLSNLSGQGDEVQPGPAIGGGLGLQLTPHFAMRATALLGAGDYRGPLLDLSDPVFRRTVVALDFQTGLPTTSGWTPYVFAGAGVARIDPRDSAFATFSSFATQFGAGTHYVWENRFIALQLELRGVAYDFDAYGLSRYQFDLELLIGAAYAIPY